MNNSSSTSACQRCNQLKHDIFAIAQHFERLGSFGQWTPEGSASSPHPRLVNVGQVEPATARLLSSSVSLSLSLPARPHLSPSLLGQACTTRNKMAGPDDSFNAAASLCSVPRAPRRVVRTNAGRELLTTIRRDGHTGQSVPLISPNI